MTNSKDFLDNPLFEELLNDYAGYWDSTDHDGMQKALDTLRTHIRANIIKLMMEQDNGR